ncbi:MAG: TonB-dependent receptor, partial [Phenylobacterium sp.]
MIWLAAGAVAAPAAHALAQPKPPAPKAAPAPAKPPATVEGVTVTADPQAFRSSIDRRSYGVATDLQATSGSIGDALRNVPSVQVDVQGNVSLRGDSNVTIMIDGKPSGMFRGEGRAQALQQLPADQIERVEVLTNPSAAFSPDGAAGVINLVTKKTRKPGRSGSMRANLGSEGRANGGISGAYNSRKLTVAGDLSARHEKQKFHAVDDRSRLDAASGQFLDSQQVIDSGNGIDMVFGRASVDYDPDAKTRLSAELRINLFDIESKGYNSTVRETASSGPLQVLERLNRIGQARSNGEASATWRRKFAGDDHELVVNVSHELTQEDRDRAVASSSRVPILPDSFEAFVVDNSYAQTELKADYTRPMPGESKLKVGYQFQFDDNDYDQVGRRGGVANALPVDPNLTNRFLYKQALNAAYATYERPFGDLTVLAGLRLEDVRVDLDQVTDRVTAENDYFRAYPSLHLAYTFSEDQQLKLSYSLRVQRPQPQDLNPFRAYQDPFNYQAGNPNLKPQETQSFEAGYQYRHSGTFYLATLYYRASENGVTDVVRDLGGGVLLTTKENLNKGRAGGLELVANGRFNPKITYNLSGNAFWNEIDASALGFTGKRSGYALSGRANLNWQVTAKDFIQLNG